MDKTTLSSIEDAVKDIKDGKFVIVVDDEDRENEGDLIIAAEKITPEKVNFMLKNARGVLCAPITIKRADELDLPTSLKVARRAYRPTTEQPRFLHLPIPSQPRRPLDARVTSIHSTPKTTACCAVPATPRLLSTSAVWPASTLPPL